VASSERLTWPTDASAPGLRRRAKPLLGTLVDIGIEAPSEAAFVRATDRAFARIADVHRLMSFHEPGSELRAIARARAGVSLHVSADTARVLRLALDMELRSGGLFNAAIAPVLVANGRLPMPTDAQAPRAHSLAAGVEWLAADRLRVRAPVWIDLGGIAKGYAVDCAVATLQASGVAAGLVNAGGDMRAFGPAAHPVHLRFADRLRPVAMLQDAALAASCNADGGLDDAQRSGSPHIDPRSGRGVRVPHSVMVQARSAAVADALTKVALLCPATAHRMCGGLRAEWRAFEFGAVPPRPAFAHPSTPALEPGPS
jgi:FAD:protein FMN transferase